MRKPPRFHNGRPAQGGPAPLAAGMVRPRCRPAIVKTRRLSHRSTQNRRRIFGRVTIRIKPFLARSAHNSFGTRLWGLVVGPTTLTDDELWRGIAKNTDTLSGLIQQQLESNGRPGQLKTMLAYGLTIDALERQYRIYSAELLRRGSAERGTS